MCDKRMNESAPCIPFLGFTCFSRQDYYPQLRDLHLQINEQDSITFGLYYDNGSCKSEMSMAWEILQGEPTPCLRIFSDAFCLLGETAFQELFAKLSNLNDSHITSDEFSRLLISLGFRDISDNPITGTAPAAAELPSPQNTEPPLREVYVKEGTEVIDRVPTAFIEFTDFWSQHNDDTGFVLLYLDAEDRIVD